MDYDLVVIGGGPAGSSLASFVAMQGHRVLLMEREHFPRHQIGESLLPSTVHGVCRLLGLEKELAQAGFQRKRGGTFLWGASDVPWTFAFSERPDSPTGYAYQVERSKFDKILLDNASRLGVEVKEGCTVSDITFVGNEPEIIYYSDNSGRSRSISSRFVADAGGHQSKFHRLVGHRMFSQFFQNIALYGYFRNGKRLASPNSGNILCAAFADGWFWYIPLSADLSSVGVVLSKDAHDIIKAGKEAAFFNCVDRCPIIRQQLSGASRVTDGEYGEFRIRKDYSYCNSRFAKEGLLLVGDAACFVDPVFSSGVHLATYSALLGARSINTVLRGAISEELCFSEFEYRYRREFGNFYKFLAAFYDMHRDEQSYYWIARRLVNSNDSPYTAFIRLVSGLSDSQEPLFSDAGFDGIGKSLASCFSDTESAPDGEMEVKAFDFDNFIPGLSTEITQMQLQAFLGNKRPSEAPLRTAGLVPSSDGLHWVIRQAASV
jgi:FAD-dependent halogenase